MSDDPLSQETLNAILSRALDPARLPRPGDQPIFSIQRTLFPNSRVADVRKSNTHETHVISNGQRLKLGILLSLRSVGPFDLRLVHEAREEAWRVVLICPRSSSQGVVAMTYSSHEVATQYAREASEIDLCWDFEPAAHFFGERRGDKRP